MDVRTGRRPASWNRNSPRRKPDAPHLSSSFSFLVIIERQRHSGNRNPMFFPRPATFWGIKGIWGRDPEVASSDSRARRCHEQCTVAEMTQRTRGFHTQGHACARETCLHPGCARSRCSRDRAGAQFPKTRSSAMFPKHACFSGVLPGMN